MIKYIEFFFFFLKWCICEVNFILYKYLILVVEYIKGKYKIFYGLLFIMKI